MKKIFFIVLASIMSTSVFAQKMWVGGSLDYSLSHKWTDYASSVSTLFTITPSFGLFVTDNISVDGTIELGFSNKYHKFGFAVEGLFWVNINNRLSYTPGVAMFYDHIKYNNSGVADDNHLYPSLKIAKFNYKLNEKFSVGLEACSLDLFNSELNSNENLYEFKLSTDAKITLRYFFN